MADTAAQREARRRKITQNAEARMNRLLGLTENREQREDSPSQNSVSHNEHSEESSNNIHLRSQSSSASAHPTSPQFSASFTPIISTDRSANRHSDDHVPIRHHAESTAVNETITGNVGGTVQQIPVQKSVATSNSDVSSHIRQFEIMKITIFIATAFLACFLLKFGIGLFIVQNIVLPFIALEVGFEYYYYLQHLPLLTSKGTMMSAALMLCGMKQEVMDTYNNIMAHVTSWISDFCLYMFSFIVWNALIA